MSRFLSSLNQSRVLLRLAVVVLLMLALPPAHYTAWVGWFADKAQIIFAPIGRPVSMVANWMRGPGTAANVDARALEEENERWHTLYLLSEAENERLRGQLYEKQANAKLNPGLGVVQITAGVYSSASDVLGGVRRVRAGLRDGVLPSSVAVGRT